LNAKGMKEVKNIGQKNISDHTTMMVKKIKKVYKDVSVIARK
jgi:hypothetical protein